MTHFKSLKQIQELPDDYIISREDRFYIWKEGQFFRIETNNYITDDNFYLYISYIDRSFLRKIIPDYIDKDFNFSKDIPIKKVALDIFTKHEKLNIIENWIYNTLQNEILIELNNKDILKHIENISIYKKWVSSYNINVSVTYKWNTLCYYWRSNGILNVKLFPKLVSIWRLNQWGIEEWVFDEYINSLYALLDLIKEYWLDLVSSWRLVRTFDTNKVLHILKDKPYRDVRESYYYENIPDNFIEHNRELYNKQHYHLCDICGWIHSIWGSCPLCRLDSYHSQTTPIYNSDKTITEKINLGFEIEKSTKLSNKDIYTLKQNKWRTEEDWSVRWGEYITPVLWLEEVKDFFKKYDFIFNYSADTTCWGHIHFSSKEYWSIKQLYRDMSPFRPLLWAIFPNRANNRFSHKDNNLWEKYRDWHLPSRISTIEFRIFPWVEKYEDIIFRTEILRFIYNNRVVNSTQSELYINAKDIIRDKIEEIVSIILIRYDKRTIPWILDRLKEYYQLEDNKRTIKVIKKDINF